MTCMLGTHLLMSDDVAGTKKCLDATKKGIEVINEDDLNELLGGAGDEPMEEVY